MMQIKIFCLTEIFCLTDLYIGKPINNYLLVMLHRLVVVEHFRLNLPTQQITLKYGS